MPLFSRSIQTEAKLASLFLSAFSQGAYLPPTRPTGSFPSKLEFHKNESRAKIGRVFVSRSGSNRGVIRHFSGLFLFSDKKKKRTVSLLARRKSKSCFSLLASPSLSRPKWKDRIFKRSLLISFCSANHTASAHNGYSDISYTWQ